MKEKLIRFVLLILSLTLLISALASCQDNEVQDDNVQNNDTPNDNVQDDAENGDNNGSFIADPIENPNPSSNFIGKEAFTFMPSEPTDRGTAEFMELFKKSKFYADFLEYGECRNIMPESVAKEYGIEAFSLVARDETNYYVLYDGRVFRVDELGGNENADHGIVQLALADYNNDGYFELLCSYNASREPDENGRWGYCHSHIFALDSRTYTDVKTYTYYDGLIFFKAGEDGLFDAYSSKDKNPENAKELCYEIKKNTTRYRFAKESVTLKTDNYEAVVTVGEGTAHFPIILDTMLLAFNVEVEMTYLGESFSYTNGTGYLDGAVSRFVCGEDTVPMMGWAEIEVVTKFMVMTGQVITRDYEYLNLSDKPSKVGVYDLIVEYRDEEVRLDNFLEITRD